LSKTKNAGHNEDGPHPISFAGTWKHYSKKATPERNNSAADDVEYFIRVAWNSASQVLGPEGVGGNCVQPNSLYAFYTPVLQAQFASDAPSFSLEA
jgi:hypothetical protein